MSAAGTECLPKLDKRLDGARILWELWGTTNVREGFVREFSPNGKFVRLTATEGEKDTGEWFEVCNVRVLEILKPGRTG